MHLIRHLPEFADRPAAVAIGNFDGLHLGHRAVIAAMHEAASEASLVPSVLTFEPHPRRFFAPTTAPFRLTRLCDKLARLRALGVDCVAMPQFTHAFAGISAEEFLDRILKQQLGAKAVVTGDNFAFGHKRRGDSAMLKAWGAQNNIRIITVPPVLFAGEVCSSSAIRTALSMGDSAKANQLLGHTHRITGRVVHGDGRGRTIGFPTANIALAPDLLLPAFGVYAVRVRLENSTYAGVANLGIRPTISVDKRASLEVHLFDTLQEIYGKKLSVCLVDKIRGEQKFENLAALTAQITRDCETAKTILASTPSMAEDW